MAHRKRKQTAKLCDIVIVPVLIPVVVVVEKTKKEARWRGWLADAHQGLAIAVAAIALTGMLLTAMHCGKPPDQPEPPKPSLTVVVDDRDVVVINNEAPSVIRCAPPD